MHQLSKTKLTDQKLCGRNQGTEITLADGLDFDPVESGMIMGTSWFAASLIMTPSELAKGEAQWLAVVASEEARDYGVTVAGADTPADSKSSKIVNVDCNLQKIPLTNAEDKYEGQSDRLRYADRELRGTYSSYSTTSLLVAGFGDELKVNDGHYVLQTWWDTDTTWSGAVNALASCGDHTFVCM